MAYEESAVMITVPANGDLSASQFKFVAVNSSGRLVASGAGAGAIGVLQDDPRAAGRPGLVAIGGVVKVKAEGTIAAGAAVASDADGGAVVAASGNVILGTAMTGGVNGDIISVLFNPRNAQA
jgi:hypothetical protein